jgi:hypothetical protein
MPQPANSVARLPSTSAEWMAADGGGGMQRGDHIQDAAAGRERGGDRRAQVLDVAQLEQVWRGRDVNVGGVGP